MVGADSYHERCIVEQLQDWINTPCTNTTDSPERSHWRDFPERQSCCNDFGDGDREGQNGNGVSQYEFPYNPAVFTQCLQAYVASFSTPEAAETYLRAPTGVYFDAKTGSVKALKVNFDTLLPFSMRFQPANRFFTEVDSWFESMLQKAPLGTGLDQGFFVSNLWTFSVYKALIQGATLSTFVSLAIAAAVLVIMTQDLRVSAFATACILMIVNAETGVLVLLEWELGPLESIIFSVAVGMSVDFVSHLSHAFVHCKGPQEGQAVSNGPRLRSRSLSLLFPAVPSTGTNDEVKVELAGNGGDVNKKSGDAVNPIHGIQGTKR